jgi:hypothetical protein
MGMAFCTVSLPATVFQPLFASILKQQAIFLQGQLRCLLYPCKKNSALLKWPPEKRLKNKKARTCLPCSSAPTQYNQKLKAHFALLQIFEAAQKNLQMCLKRQRKQSARKCNLLAVCLSLPISTPKSRRFRLLLVYMCGHKPAKYRAQPKGKQLILQA